MPISRLRQFLTSHNLDGLYFLRTDPHFTENLPEHEEFLQYVTGFTGSAGLMIITHTKAALFIDGRYTTQAPMEVDEQIWDIVPWEAQEVEAWCRLNTANLTFGYDTLRMNLDTIEKASKYITLAPLTTSPFTIWQNRPAANSAAIVQHSLEFSGATISSKFTQISNALIAKKAEILLVTQLDNLAWALNLRGSDIPYCPLFYGAALIAVDGNAMLYTHNFVGDDLPLNIKIEPFAKLSEDLAQLHTRHKSILLDKAKTNAAWVNLLQNSPIEIIWEPDPITQLKAVKNEVELEGMRRAHAKDAHVFKAFNAWFSLNAPKGKLTELDIVEVLTALRMEAGAVQLSFPIIAGVGANGAIVHYHATPKTNAKLEVGGLLLLDSGAQYLEATTDITRTYAIGKPSAQMVRHNTLVLKAHIQLSMTKFPAGTTGVQLDAITRAPLWAKGLDFAHGTGHGVGSYLCVHEGPASISKRGTVAIEAGMVLTNEPGLYIEGQYGIRIENMMAVRKSETHPNMLEFETLTQVPYDTSLIDFTLLTSDERKWLTTYLGL